MRRPLSSDGANGNEQLLLRIRRGVLLFRQSLGGEAVEGGEGSCRITVVRDLESVLTEVLGEEAAGTEGGEPPVILGVGRVGAQGGSGEDDGQDAGGPEDAVELRNRLGGPGSAQLQDAEDTALTGVRDVGKGFKRLLAGPDFEAGTWDGFKEVPDVTGFHGVVRFSGAERGLGPERTDRQGRQGWRPAGAAQAANKCAEQVAGSKTRFSGNAPGERVVPHQAAKNAQICRFQ